MPRRCGCTVAKGGIPPVGVMLEERVQRNNFIANTFDGDLFSLGFSLASQQTVLPVFVKNLGGNNFHLGLIPVLWTAGVNFPQIFIAPYAERFALKKPLFLKTALFQRLPWLIL